MNTDGTFLWILAQPVPNFQQSVRLLFLEQLPPFPIPYGNCFWNVWNIQSWWYSLFMMHPSGQIFGPHLWFFGAPQVFYYCETAAICSCTTYAIKHSQSTLGAFSYPWPEMLHFSLKFLNLVECVCKNSGNRAQKNSSELNNVEVPSTEGNFEHNLILIAGIIFISA